MRKVIAIVVMMAAVVTFVAFNADAKEKGIQVQGEKLVQGIWADMKAKRWDKLEKMMTPGFQSIHSDGARDHSAQLQLLKDLNIGKYKISNVKVTESGSTLVVTYNIAVTETIDGKRLSTAASPRMSVFVRERGAWLWAAHANLNPVH